MAKIISKSLVITFSKLAPNSSKDVILELPVDREDIKSLVQELVGDTYVVDIENDSNS